MFSVSKETSNLLDKESGPIYIIIITVVSLVTYLFTTCFVNIITLVATMHTYKTSLNCKKFPIQHVTVLLVICLKYSCGIFELVRFILNHYGFLTESLYGTLMMHVQVYLLKHTVR